MMDLTAIRRLKSGDLSGLETLIARYQVRAVRTAFFIVHDEQLAEDIVQEAFLRITQRIQGFDEDRPFEPYLMRSVVNGALNVAQRRARSVSLDLNDDGRCLEQLLSQAVSVESQIEFSQLKEDILEALFQLPPRQRAAIVQRYYLEMSEAEMASALESPPGTVKWLLNAARKRLRALLASQRSAE